MKITINGKICEAREGEYILNVARREGVFIPALCYLTGCSPTLACRLCMVEADGKRVYSCNAKVKEDMQILTNSPEIAAERNAIMQSYCVNHPLQCGVCDQSGECELQNFTQKMRVNSQNYAIRDTHKPHKKWGLINYDPALCIVCERCVTVCKDKIGESALKTVPRGADQVPKEMKDAMPKDAFAVWSRLQKSLIAPSEGDALDCSFCGECVSVCPVGALISADFQYSSNAWELRRVPAANPHFSDCELLYYEVKPRGIEDRREKIYRVTNDFHFGELNGAARWGFDFHDPGARKDEAKFARIVSKFKDGSIKNIKFNSFITNEEALILERLREKFNLSLINDEARAYQAFLEGFSQACGRSVYSGDTNELKNSDFIVVAGSMLRYDAPNVSYRVNNALTINKASGFYFHPIADAVTRKYSKNFDVIAHEAGLEEQILLLLLAKFGRDLPREVGEFLDRFKFTEQKTVKKSVTREVTEKIDGQSENLEEATKQIAEEVEEIIELQRLKIASELGLSEERLDALAAGKERKILIIGEDFYRSPRAAALAKYAGLIERYAGFKLILIPPRTNSLGVAKICKLSAKPQAGATLGYNEAGDFKFCVHGGDIDAGALNQQEGTFTSVDARVTPTNAALAHEGYFLNDLANALGLCARYTIDYTPLLPVSAGFKAVKFDDLQNFYDNGGTAHRGYKLENLALDSSKASAERAQGENQAQDLDARRQENGENLERNFSDFPQPLGARKFNLYRANPIGVTLFSARSRQLAQTGALFASAALAAKLGLSGAAIIEKGAVRLGISVKIDKNLEGEVAYLGDFDPMIPYEEIFEGARFAQVEISPVSGEFLNLNSAKILDAADKNEK
ncbi:NADH-quinone oxidoreductase subunit G [uncultured Campylobacter sp.]|uniref:NADH-quinone oxidoreductase subunit G n=1 Tax=uncultured Campylobacter sp. TaxID=218934 RepID=UPI0025F15768|nr:NADH-quinone oxidoreductase subunit G [uncultured Campylobacter sp.]